MPTLTFNPSSLALPYKKYTTPNVYPVELVSNEDFLLFRYQVTDTPSWIELINISFSPSPDEALSFIVRAKSSYANAMTPGVYEGKVKIRINRGTVFIDKTLELPITFTVQDTVFLDLSPTTMVFNYLLGDSFPQNQTLTLTSESSWQLSASQSWVTFSTITGTATSQVFIGVDPTGLPVGTYEAIITAVDDYFTKTMTVVLNISEGDTEISYLYVDPRNLEFVSEVGVVNTTQRPLNLETSHNWIATPSETWLQIDSESGTAGIETMQVNVDSVALAVGVYTAFITFTVNDIIKKVYVVLRVVEFLTDGFISEGLYFEEDRNKFKATNTQQNTFLNVEVTTNTPSETIIYILESPFFQGVAETLIGSETSNLLKSVVPTSNFTSRIQNNIQPIRMNLAAFIENKITESIAVLDNFTNLRFLTGHTPEVENKLCYIPGTVYLTKNAILSLAVLAETAPTEIAITGDATAIIASGLSAGLFVYNAIVNLSELTLTTGNTITITFGTLAVNVVIKETTPETNILAFENEWREYEFFECTGYLTTAPSVKKTTTELQVEGEKHSKIVNIDSGVNYTLNTGYISTQEEKEWLSRILDARRLFLYENGTPTEIELTTKSLELYKTRLHTTSYKLKFKKAII